MSQPEPVGPALPEKKPCIFYKLMVASILQDNKLRIPHKFVKKYGDELSVVATLAVPSGRIWLVELKKDNKRMWFDIGWNQFVKYYSIRVGFFLVFGYEGNSHFNVHVYDLTASEINYIPNTSLNNSEESSQYEHVKNVEDGDRAKILGSQATCSSSSLLINNLSDECLDLTDKNKNSTTGAGTEILHQKNGEHDLQATLESTRDKGVQSSGIEFSSTADEVGRCSSIETQQITKKVKQETEPNIDEHKSLVEIEVKEKLQAPDSPSKISRRWRDVTPEERQSAIRAAETFKPDNPSCQITLQPSYVYRGIQLHIPRWFTRRYLNEVNDTITLQISEGKTWPVRCVYGNGSLKFSRGWSEFVLDNSLDEGDVCVFELINTKQIVLKVTIFRVLEAARPVKQT